MWLLTICGIAHAWCRCSASVFRSRIYCEQCIGLLTVLHSFLINDGW